MAQTCLRSMKSSVGIGTSRYPMSRSSIKSNIGSPEMNLIVGHRLHGDQAEQQEELRLRFHPDHLQLGRGLARRNLDLSLTNHLWTSEQAAHL